MLVVQAAKFAARAHAGQTRDDNKTPYIQHPGRVSSRVAIHDEGTDVMVAAAWLHDTVEDTSVTEADLLRDFGPEVTGLVMELTNPSKGQDLPRSEKKRMDREYLAKVSRQAKIIKMLDRIDNLEDLNSRGPEFTVLYAEESQMLAAVIGDADPQLQKELQCAASRSVEDLA